MPGLACAGDKLIQCLVQLRQTNFLVCSIEILIGIVCRGKPDMDKWEDSKNLDFITEAGWYFKTLAAQEPGNINLIGQYSF